MQKSNLLCTPPLTDVSSAAQGTAESTKPVMENESAKAEESRSSASPTGKDMKLMPNRLRFAPTVAAVQVSHSEWRLWGVLNVSGRYRDEDVLVLIEIAEDAEFSQIVHKGKAIANKQNNFAINYIYMPSNPNRLLFYRFKTLRMRVKDGVGRERKIVMSSVGEMSPWKQ